LQVAATGKDYAGVTRWMLNTDVAVDVSQVH